MSAEPHPVSTPEEEKSDVRHLEVGGLEYDDPVKRANFVTDNSHELSNYSSWTFSQTVRRFWRSVLYACMCGVCAMTDGYSYKMPGNIVALKGFIRQFGTANAAGTYKLNAHYVANWGGIYAGAFIFALLIGHWPVEKFGRKPVLWLVQLLMLVAALVEMFAKNWKIWAIAKVLNGLSVGFNHFTSTTYISEIAPTKARGACLSFYSLFWALGAFAAAIGLQIVSTMSIDKWRHAVYSQWAFIGMAIIMLVFIPESPRFLAAKGRHDKAKKILKHMNGNVEGYDLEHEYSIILKELEDGKILSDKQKEVNVLDCFRGTNLRRTIVSLVPYQNQLWNGAPVVFVYTSYFFQAAGIAKTFTATVAVNTVLVAFVLLSFFTLDKFGRRPLLIYCGALMIPCLFIAGGIWKASHTSGSGAAGVAFMCLWVALYSSSAGPLGFAFLAECSTVILRAKTANMGALAFACMNLVTSYCTPLMIASTTFGVSGTLFFYGATSLVFLVVMWFVVPETKNRSNVELDEMFELKVPTREFGTFETSLDRARKAAMQTA